MAYKFNAGHEPLASPGIILQIVDKQGENLIAPIVCVEIHLLYTSVHSM